MFSENLPKLSLENASEIPLKISENSRRNLFLISSWKLPIGQYSSKVFITGIPGIASDNPLVKLPKISRRILQKKNVAWFS